MRYTKGADELLWAVLWIICILLMVISMTAMARAQTPMNVGLSWTPPTERTDGTPLKSGELTGFIVLCDTRSNPPSPGYALRYTTTATSFSKEELMELMGVAREVTYFCAVRATAMCNGSPCSSARSAEVSFVIPAEQQPPMPPVLVVQEGIQAAYALVQSENRLALVPVGTVPAGTECDTQQQIRDANGVQGYVVPRNVVVWAGTVRPQVVVAQCG